MSDNTSNNAPDFTQMSDEWWIELRKHATDQVLKTGTTADLPAAGPAVVVTAVGAKTGLPRSVPLLRIEHEGRYRV
jgi:hypothetical protein